MLHSTGESSAWVTAASHALPGDEHTLARSRDNCSGNRRAADSTSSALDLLLQKRTDEGAGHLLDLALKDVAALEARVAALQVELEGLNGWIGRALAGTETEDQGWM